SITEKTVDKDGKRVDNYVVEREFPTARDNKKRILPLRMANVSAKRLEVFKGMPPYVNARNEEALATALIRGLGKEILAPRRDEARHDYYIGLAYLYGVDTEIDRAVALSLIKRSAERGYSTAMERLALMYTQGDGVGIDYSEALAWQRRAVEKYRTLLSDGAVEYKNFIGYFSALTTLCDHLFEVGGAADEIARICDDALAIARALYTVSRNPISTTFLAAVYLILGNNYLHGGDFAAALENAHSAREILERGDAEEWNYDANLLSVYSLLELIYRTLGDRENRARYQNEIDRVRGEDDGAESESAFAFGILKNKDGMMSEDGMHLAEYDGALAILEQECQRDPTDERLRRLAHGYATYATNLSRKLREQRRSKILPASQLTGLHVCDFDGENGREERLSLFREVIRLNQRSIEIYGDIAGRTDVASDLRNLADQCRTMAEFILDLLPEFNTGDGQASGYYTDADGYFARAVELYFKIVRRTNYAEDKNNLIEIIAQRADNLGDMYMMNLGGEELLHNGIALLDEGMKIANELLAMAKSMDFDAAFDSLCLAYNELYLALGDDEKADHYLRLASIPLF
ncbi:MAG: sel1 repeat family protein, partial [Clostridia bacterium]|nr:sel1 repeat family protein [Clostridia bacterium]